MAELATIARPYAEALFKAIGPADAPAVAQQIAALAALAADPQLRTFADSPKVTDEQVFDLFTGVCPVWLGDGAKNLLRAMIENGRLAALPEVAAQYQALVNASTGVSDAVIHSAWAILPQQLDEIVAVLEKRFARKLNVQVKLDPELIGGIRVVVGDEVLDTSVRARLEQMKVALTA
jgi:F-type H+-transporting ATPase subunit delta